MCLVHVQYVQTCIYRTLRVSCRLLLPAVCVYECVEGGTEEEEELWERETGSEKEEEEPNPPPPFSRILCMIQS